jgi:L-lactate dehydrogenase complex protein LldG
MSGSATPDVPTAREVILARVREALRQPAALPHGLRVAEASGPPAGGGLLPILPAEAARPWLPDGGGSPEERIAALAENLGRLRAGFERVGSPDAACERIAELCLERNWRRLAGHRHPLVDRVLDRAGSLAERSILRVEEGRSTDSPGDPQVAEPRGDRFDKDALEACDVGITACEAIVSQTGSVLVASGTGGGRSLSVLPHAHVVVATADQVVATLADALEMVRPRHGGRLPSMLSFITGPSRTGDIERILVLGAHGPRELVVVLIG